MADAARASPLSPAVPQVQPHLEELGYFFRTSEGVQSWQVWYPQGALAPIAWVPAPGAQA